MIRAFLCLFFLPFSVLGADDGTGQTACCCVGVVIAVLAAVGFSESRKNKQTQNTGSSAGSNVQTTLSPPPVGGMPTRFDISVLPWEREFGDTKMDCLCISIRGPINLPPNQLTVSFSLSLWDVTSGAEKDKRQPVLCSLPELQLKGTQMFYWTHVMQMPYANNMMQNWAEILAIPLDLLTFPCRGERMLEFELTIAPIGQYQTSAAHATYVYKHANKVIGYVDGIRLRIKAEELGLKFAAAVSAVDGVQDAKEKALVRQWMDSRIDSLPENLRPETTRSLSRALMLAERLGASIKPEEIAVMCEELAEQYPVKNLPRGDLYDVVKLCMEVAAADGSAGREELELIDRISVLLNVDRETFTKYRDKLLPASMHSEKDMETILGLDPSWTAKEKKKHLRGLYREWSSRVTHSDPKVRDQAGEMLDLISEERAKLDAEN